MPVVTIEARREVERAVHTFVYKITHSTRFADASLARWQGPLCFAVAGLPRSEGEFVLGRLSEIATASGAQVARRGCSPYNFYVIFTVDSDHTVKYLYDHHRGVFDWHADPPKVRRFLNPSKPAAVRVWQNAGSVGVDGASFTPGGGGGISLGSGSNSTPFNVQRGPDVGRLTLQAVQGLTLALVIIDANRVNGAKLGQITDYAAMAGLVDLELDSDLAETPTILRLFTEAADARPRGLTSWDQAFLRETYHTSQSATNQRAQITWRVVNDVSP